MELERELLEALVDEHGSDAAAWLEALPSTEVAEVLALLPARACSEVLEKMAPLAAARALLEVDVEHGAAALQEVRPDAALRLLRVTSPERRAALLEQVAPERRALLARQLSYPEGTAGALLDARIATGRETWTAGEALENLQRSPDDVTHYLYVVDERNRLTGVLNLRELLCARPGQQLGSICRRAVHTLSARSPWAAVLSHRGWRWVHALPVVDERGVFLGVIRYKTLKQIEQELPDGAAADGLELDAGSALGELYGLSVRGLLEWGATLIQGGAAPDVGRRR